MPTLGEQLHEYNLKFFGYGSWESKIWFVGMEEGGADSSATSAIEKRLALWYAHKHPTLEDAPSIYGELEYSKPWFAQRPTVQPTWRQLIRVVAASKHQKPTNEEIADIQKTSWVKFPREGGQGRKSLVGVSFS